MIEQSPKYDFKRQLASFVEKVLVTFVQTFLSYFMMAGALGADAAQAAALAAIASAGTAGLAALPVVPDGLPFATDLLFRTVRTFVVAAGTPFFAAEHFELSVSALEAAVVGAVPAALAVAKGLIAKRFGEAESPAILSKKLDPKTFAIAA